MRPLASSRAALAVAAACVVGSFGIACADDTSLVDVARVVPADVDLVVAIDGVARSRRTPVGHAVADLARSVGLLEAIEPAWAELAEALGMTPERAFDAILGERVVYVARLDITESSWALVSEVTPQTAKRIRQRLKPAPRDVLGGRPVLTIEGGLLRVVESADGPRRRLLIGPGENSGLFDEIARTFGRGPDPSLADTPWFEGIHRLGRAGDVLLMARTGMGEGTRVAALARSQRETVEMNFLFETDELRACAGAIKSWSRETFDTLADGAYATILDLNLSPDHGGWGVLPIPIPERVRGLMGDRLALLIRPADEGPIEFAVSVETDDVGALSRVGDAGVEAFVAGLPGGRALAPRVAGFGAAPATAVRTVDLADAIPVFGSFGWKTGPHLSWRGRCGTEPCETGQKPGWWTVGLGASAVEDLSRALVAADESGEVSLPWLSMGQIRFADLERALRTAKIPLPEGVAQLGAFEEVTWEALEMSGGVVVGSGRVRVRGLDFGVGPALDNVAGYREGQPSQGPERSDGRRER